MIFNLAEIRPNRNKYIFILILSLAVHAALFMKIGPIISTDYQVRYEPQVRVLVDWLHGNGDFPIIQGYHIFHFGYVVFITIVDYIFGLANLEALILVQMFISALTFMLIFHILITKLKSAKVAIIFSILAIIFFDNVHFATCAVPDSLYRTIFLFSYYLLLELYFNNKYSLFLFVAAFSFLILVVTRVDTIIYFIPIYFLILNIIARGKRWVKIGLCLLSLLGIMVMRDTTKVLYEILETFYERGIIILGMDNHIPGITTIGQVEYYRNADVLYVIGRVIKLFALRVYQYLNIFPPLWSKAHQLYYSFHAVILYTLALIGIVKAWRTKDKYFLLIIWVFIAALILQGITFVDAALRTSFTALTFLIMFAGYGFDYIFITIRERRTMVTFSRNKY